MYSGQHDASNTTKLANTTFTDQRQLYLASSGMSYSTPPRVILSLMGFAQNAPTSGNISMGFDANIISVTTVNFTSQHNIYGADLYYLSYMFLGIDQSMTQFSTGYYTQICNKKLI